MSETKAPLTMSATEAHKRAINMRREDRYSAMMIAAGFPGQDVSAYKTRHQVLRKIKDLKKMRKLANLNQSAEEKEARREERRRAARQAKVDSGLAPLSAIYLQDPIVAYEADAACALIVDYFNANDKRWFALRDATVWAVRMTDLCVALAPHGEYDPSGHQTEASAVFKLMAMLLRGKGLHVGKRIGIGGASNTPVWRNEAVETQHLRKRLTILGNKALGGHRTAYDQAHRLSFP